MEKQSKWNFREKATETCSQFNSDVALNVALQKAERLAGYIETLTRLAREEGHQWDAIREAKTELALHRQPEEPCQHLRTTCRDCHCFIDRHVKKAPEVEEFKVPYEDEGGAEVNNCAIEQVINALRRQVARLEKRADANYSLRETQEHKVNCLELNVANHEKELGAKRDE